MNNTHQEDFILAEAIKLLNELVEFKKGRRLSEPEVAVIRGAWYGESYEEMARKSGHKSYKQSYLHNTVAPKLWDLLSEILGNGGKVLKQNLRASLERLVEEGTRKISVRLLGEAPLISCFHGRQAELADLKAQVLQKRLVYVFGEAGIGKSALVAKLLADLGQEFDLLVWKSVAHSPSSEELTASLHRMLNLDGQPSFSCLREQLRLRRILLVLDGVEAILSKYNQRVEYIKFFLSLMSEMDKSCLILTSRESFIEINALSKTYPILLTKIEGLDVRAGIEIFRDKGLIVEQESTQIVELIRYYRGNPGELESLVHRINYLFGGDINKFWDYKTTFLSEYLQNVLNEIFAQSDLLSSLQRQILIYLAEELSQKTEPIKFSSLLDFFVNKLSVGTSILINALEDLARRQLIEVMNGSLKSEVCYILAPGVKKYILLDPLKLVRQGI